MVPGSQPVPHSRRLKLLISFRANSKAHNTIVAAYLYSKLQNIPQLAREACIIIVTQKSRQCSSLEWLPWLVQSGLCSGKKNLGNMMKQMSQKAKVSQNYTNHSLWAFAATNFKLECQKNWFSNIQATGITSVWADIINLLDVSNIMANVVKPDSSFDV